MAIDGGEGGTTVGRGDHVEPVALEVGAHEPDDLLVVVHDEDRTNGTIERGHGGQHRTRRVCRSRVTDR